MFPFPFNKKLDINKEYSLTEIPLFTNLSPSDLKFVEKRIRLVEYKKNEIVYSQGAEPDAFYVICSGRFRVFIRSGSTERTVTYLYRGDYFGEISILTGKPHSVTVEAINDSLVLKLSKNHFNELLKSVPSMALHLSRSLGLRLRDESKEETGQAKIVAIYNLKEGVGQTTFVENLALSIQREIKKPVLYIDMNTDGKAGRDLLGPEKKYEVLHIGEMDISRDSEIDKFLCDSSLGVTLLNLQNGGDGNHDNIYEKKLTTLLTYLVSRFNFVLVDLPREINEIVFKVLSQSDVIYVLTDGELMDLDKCRSVISEMKKSFTFGDEQIRLILSEAQGKEHPPVREIEKIIGHKVFALLPRAAEVEKQNVLAQPLTESSHFGKDEQSSYYRATHYLARELSGKLVGLALGSGAAHGFAHVGVIKVLERAGIPIDVIAGSSMGSLIGTLWASGYSAQDLEKLALSFDKKNSFFKLLGFGDFSIAHQGFFKGRMVVRFLRTLLGQKTFQDLKIPMKIVATNLLTAEEVVFEEGDLVEAIRASISIPGIFRPFRINGKILIDGGVIDPVPVKVLTRMGVRKIIAVNVLSGPSDILIRREILKHKAEEMEKKAREGGPLQRWFFELKKRIGNHYAANIFNVLMNTIQFMEYSIASTATTEADVVIHPVIYDANWIEFYSAEKFVRIGEEKASEQLLEIQKLVEQ